MDTTPANSTRVVGCGRWLHRDDQVGLRVVELLRASASLPGGVVMTEAPGAELADQLDGCKRLILIDAAAATEKHPAGSWQVIDYRRTPERLRLRRADDTHTLGVASALKLAEAMGLLPEVVTIYAIAIHDARQGDELTPQVAAAIPQVITAIEAELRQDQTNIVEGAIHA